MAPKRKSEGALGAPKKTLKQGNLFSFFSKKETTAKPSKKSPVSSSKAEQSRPSSSKATQVTSSSATSASTSSSSLSSQQQKQQQKSTANIRVGTRIEVYWPDDDEYYSAVIQKQQQRGDPLNVYVEYEDDGQGEWINLKTEKYRILAASKKKRRRIQDDDDDDDDEEHEFEDAVSSESEGSAYVGDGKKQEEEDDDDDDDQWMVTDDEDDQEIASKKKKRVTVTHHHGGSSSSSSSRPSKTPARSNNKNNSSSKAAALTATPFQQTPKHVTPALSSASSITKSSSSKHTPLLSQASASSLSHLSPTTTTTTSSTSPPMYVKNALNPAGSHVHNHLRFLHQPRDAQRRPQDDAEYDPRTLHVVPPQLERHGVKLTAAVQQWWDLKAQYFDTVLLFKTGKFYELFHMDADIGVNVLGLSYMKGHVAHAGFPEVSYGAMADKLVQAGYKVARVEQTETPQQLAQRKKQKKGSKSSPTPKVVNREVCSILTLGTRTFCYLDDEKSLLEETSAAPTSHGGAAAIGPLLAIREVLIETTTTQQETANDDDDTVQPVCEYGITLVDAVRGSVTIGQFADDLLRSRMNTLLTAFTPSEILLQGGEQGASPSLHSLIRSLQTTTQRTFRVETIRSEESFPKSTAIDPQIRQQLERRNNKVHPWEVEETLEELHRRQYYPRASKKQEDRFSVSRWPRVLKAAVEGKAELALSSFGAALFYLQRNLIDSELLSLGIIKAYIPPASCASQEEADGEMSKLAADQCRAEAAAEFQAQQEGSNANGSERDAQASSEDPGPMDISHYESVNAEENINHMALDGTTLRNLEILTNSVDDKVTGSLWSLINHTKTPHGSRLLRAWLLRPLFRKADIDRRADAVQELVSGAAAVALSEATSVLAKCGDIERLLSRVHSMSGGSTAVGESEDDASSRGIHPNDRAVLYEIGTYTKRKVGDFSKVLYGLRHVTQIPEIFSGIEIQSGLLGKIVRPIDQGGCFPDMTDDLDWFFANFDCDLAAKGLFEPSKGIDEAYDEACETIERIESALNDYKEEMCANALRPKALARSSWKYINTKPDSKDKYLVELPISVTVPDDFILKGKRGKGPKQVNKYRTSFVEEQIEELERAIDIQKKRKARGMQLIFARFDSKRALWAAAAQATALLDALGSLAKASSNAGYTRPTILDCPPGQPSSIKVIQGRHPCVEKILGSGEFVPNDLSLGSETENGTASRVLLLSGVNMGGKSTCLRQTCLLAIMAQIGCYVPADECCLTPVDRIYTRLGASDRILVGQSTFFVELAETAAALRGATRRSLVIMDELGRGTSTFDGTAIASAAVKHLVERSKCLTLFATHYHSLLDEWKDNPSVRLGHMECVVENGQVSHRSGEPEENTITFLYTLGEGGCPKSFGINVSRLAGLPEDVLSNAKRISEDFEKQMNNVDSTSKVVTARSARDQKQRILNAIQSEKWNDVLSLWNELQI